MDSLIIQRALESAFAKVVDAAESERLGFPQAAKVKIDEAAAEVTEAIADFVHPEEGV